MAKKIKVVDVVVDSLDIITENEDEKVEIEELKETVTIEPVKVEVENESVKIELTEPVKRELTEPVKIESNQDYKSIRTQQLVECPKCSKMMTATSLKYYHNKTCLAEQTSEIKPKTKIKIIIPETNKKEPYIEAEESFSEEEVKIIKAKPKKEIVLEKPVLTSQEQRMQYINQQKNNRQQKINCLFMGAV